MESLEMVFEPLPGEALTRFLTDNVINDNMAKDRHQHLAPCWFFLEERTRRVVGGLTGYVWAGWFHVDFLWVAEPLRRRGHASRMMDAAEAMAVERGALTATLETHSFQAPDFYMKRGYSVFGRLDDYPTGHTKLFLRKHLDETLS